MKKLLVLFIILTIFLSGCSLLNLNDFVLPNDIEFINTIEILDTPEKICNYMLDNFTYELHLLNILNPYQLYITQKGDCDDFANFSIFISNYHGYETFLIKIHYKNCAINHYLAIYKENGLYNFSDNQNYFPLQYNNFFNIVELNSQRMYYSFGYIWSSYVVYDYWNNIVEQVTK